MTRIDEPERAPFSDEYENEDATTRDESSFHRRERTARPPLGVSELVRRAIETTVGARYKDFW